MTFLPSPTPNNFRSNPLLIQTNWFTSNFSRKSRFCIFLQKVPSLFTFSPRAQNKKKNISQTNFTRYLQHMLCTYRINISLIYCTTSVALSSLLNMNKQCRMWNLSFSPKYNNHFSIKQILNTYTIKSAEKLSRTLLKFL